MRASPGVETLDDMLLGRLAPVAARVGVSFLPALVCGPAQGYGWHIGVDPDLDERSRGESRREVLDAIESEADRRGLSLSFAQVLDEEVELRGLPAKRGRLTSRNVPVARLDVRWRSMEEYFAQMPRRRRRTIRRESRRNADAGVSIGMRASCAGLQDRVLELLE